jgi:hypothetical protein
MQTDVQRLTLHHHHYLVEMNFLMEMKAIQVEMKKMEVEMKKMEGGQESSLPLFGAGGG